MPAMDSGNPNPPPKRKRRFLGFARKRSAPVEEVHLVHGTGKVDWHSPHGKVPEDIARFEKMHFQLENPEKLDPSVYAGGTLKGWNVRYYDPKEYAEKGTGIQHERAFNVEERDELRRFLKKDLAGDVSSEVESSHKPRTSVQKIIEKDGKTYRVNVDASELF